MADLGTENPGVGLVRHTLEELPGGRIPGDGTATTADATDTADTEAVTERLLREDLGDYELEPENLVLLNGDLSELSRPNNHDSWPAVAIVGHPNVGESTLVNWILGRRITVVLDEPEVTRDRVIYDADWNGRNLHLIDTGDWDVGVKGLDRAVATQAEIAIEMADVSLFVVDANVGATTTDGAMTRLLHASKKPVILVANEVGSERTEAGASGLWNLDLDEPYPISALHGRGMGELLDVLLDASPTVTAHRAERPADSTPQVALVGRPNVGKSPLLNSLAGSGRSVVSGTPDTTYGPADEVLEPDGKEWIFVDTAGIKRRIKQTVRVDYCSVLRTRSAIESAKVTLVLLNGGEPLSEQDVKVVNLAVESGRALVLVNNKWDSVGGYRQQELKREQGLDLAHVPWASKINIAAKTGWHMNRIMHALEAASEEWTTRTSTSRLDTFLGELVAAHPHPLRGGKQPRVLYATQTGVCPPRLVLFTTELLDPQYRRFIERRLHEIFGFVGTPVQVGVRVREKRHR